MTNKKIKITKPLLQYKGKIYSLQVVASAKDTNLLVASLTEAKQKMQNQLGAERVAHRIKVAELEQRYQHIISAPPPHKEWVKNQIFFFSHTEEIGVYILPFTLAPTTVIAERDPETIRTLGAPHFTTVKGRISKNMQEELKREIFIALGVTREKAFKFAKLLRPNTLNPFAYYHTLTSSKQVCLGTLEDTLANKILKTPSQVLAARKSIEQLLTVINTNSLADTTPYSFPSLTNTGLPNLEDKLGVEEWIRHESRTHWTTAE